MVGRTVILHTGADSCTGAAGNAGTMMAQGVVGIVAPPAGLANLAAQTEQTGNFTGTAVMRRAAPDQRDQRRRLCPVLARPMRPT